MRTGLGYLFDPALAGDPDKAAILQEDRALSYAALDRLANQVAWGLRRIGIGPRDRVAFLFENDHRFVPCYFGVLRAGAVVVPVNHRLSDGGVTHVLSHCDARLLLSTAGQTDRALALLRQAGLRMRTVALDSPGRDLPSYEAWVESMPDGEVPVAVSEADIAIQAYTAGSTGRPKGCRLSHGGALWNVTSALPLLELTAEDRALVAAPLGHKNATASLKRFLRVGGSAVMLRAFEPDAYLAAVARFQVTCTTGVPAMYQMLCSRGEPAGRYDTRSVRYCFVASARVPYGLDRRLTGIFPNARVREVYGATEAGYLMQPADGSPGLVPTPGTEVRLVREDGTPCQAEESGEILFRNPGVACGYHKDPQTTVDRIREGWYLTGDLGRQTAEGRFFILGRKDDMINTGGEHVYPREIEEILLRHPMISDVCVVPVPHAIKGEVPVAFVASRQPDALRESDVKSHFLAQGAPFAHPRRVFFVPALPLSASGKVDRSLLRQQAGQAIVSGECPG